MSEGLTEQERAVLDRLAQAFDAFAALAVEHPDHLLEFRLGIHRLQDLIGARPTWRAMRGETGRGEG